MPKWSASSKVTDTAFGQFNRDRRELAVSVTVREPCPDMWGVLIGEILHNFRSSLDHLVWELVILETGKPPQPTKAGTTPKTGFPVFQYFQGYKSDRGEPLLLRGVGSSAKALIESLQPFSTGEGVNSPLWHMKELNDFDKHRTLHLTGASLHGGDVVFPDLAPGVSILEREVRQAGPVEDGTVLFRARLSGTKDPFQPGAEVEVESPLLFGVAFDQTSPAVGGALVIPTLGTIGVRVDEILKRAASEIFGTTFVW
jgi:hypothetical protein